MWILAPHGLYPRSRPRPPVVSETRLCFTAPFTVSEHSTQISDTQCYRLHVTIALIYLYWPMPLAVVELTRVLDASSRLERPALALSIIDNDLHIG